MGLIKRILIIGIILAITTLSMITAVTAAPADNAADRVVIYMIDNLNVHDINFKNTPYLYSLQNKGGVGLLNTVTGGERTVKNACVTISAGKIAVGSNSAHLNYPADAFINYEKASSVFLRNTGFLPDDENIIVTNIEVIKRNNEIRNLGKPGQLGDSLNSWGLSTAVVGNSDRFDLVDRPGALILMNSRGIVDQGAIENSDVNSYWTNYSLLQKQIDKVKASEVILVEYGDLTRLEAMYTLYSVANYKDKRRQILASIDQSIQQIDMELGTNNTHRYIISPSPSRNSLLTDALLTPIIIIKSDNNGTLTSSSTRREGIVLLSNLKNSIISSFNPAIKDPIYITPRENPNSYLTQLNKMAVFSYANQSFILTALMTLLTILIISAFLILYKTKSNLIMLKLLTLVLSIPLVLLFISLLPIYNKFLFIGITIILCLITTALVITISQITKYSPLIIILLMTIFTICLDLIIGLDLIAKSIMSYQIISGARYYGLGNEYMGVLIGATISLAALYLNQSNTPKRLTAIKALFVIVIFLIAYPLFGINVGGTITACIALGFTILIFNKEEINILDLLGILIGTGVVLCLVALIDISQPTELQSHLAKNISLISRDGIGAIFIIIKRKLAMHIQILNYKYFGWILLAIIAAIALLLFRPSKKLITFKSFSNKLYLGLQGIIIAAIIAILFNDSGITAAATMFIYFFCILIYALRASENG